MALMQEPKDPAEDLLDFTGLVYGGRKFGKTTGLASFPGVYYATCEPGTKGLPIRETTIDTWKDMRQMVRDLKKDDDPSIRTVVIDTADRAYDKCLDYVCKRLGIPYPGETPDGENDWGKSWRAVKTEFMDQVEGILNSGRTIWFTSHADTETVKPKGRKNYDRVCTSMGSQAQDVVESLVDMFFYGDKVLIDDSVERVLFCEGDTHIWAGFRTPAQFPQVLHLPDENWWEHLCKGFEGKAEGVDPDSLRTAPETSAPTTESVKESKKRKRSKSKKTSRKRKRS